MSIHTIKDSILGVPREEDNSTYDYFLLGTL